MGVGTETTWIDPTATVERVELGAASWIDVVRGMLLRAGEVHDDLARTAPWEQGRVFRYERWIDDPRLSAWQAGGAIHPALAEVQSWISARYHVRFDGVSLARYRDGRDGVGWHRDRELQWLDDTLIGVLTTGEQRPFLVKPVGRGRDWRDSDPAGSLDLRPAGGDLLVMGGRCQADWLHAVPQIAGPCRSRISAQWRWTSRRGRRDPNPSFYAPRHFSR